MRGWRRIAGLVGGVALDALLGDPRRGHPVAVFGRGAAATERLMYADSRTRGIAFTAVCVGAATAAPSVASAVVRRVVAASPDGANARGLTVRVGRGATTTARRWAAGRGTAGAALATWAVLGGTSLAREGIAMAEQLEDGDLERARERLPHLCGRDPRGLGEKEMARATVESVAENTSDAVVAPLFWGAVAGVPGLLAYRAINTLDAMVGHRNDRYRNFGCAAARLDDAANWIPARLTGVLAAACAPVCGGSVWAGLRVLARDGGRHPSPNAGRPEAAFAGVLGVRLGGANSYHGTTELRPRLGDGAPPSVADIRRAVRLSRAITLAATITVALASVVAANATRGHGRRAGQAAREVRGRVARQAAGQVRRQAARQAPGRAKREARSRAARQAPGRATREARSRAARSRA